MIPRTLSQLRLGFWVLAALAVGLAAYAHHSTWRPDPTDESVVFYHFGPPHPWVAIAVTALLMAPSLRPRLRWLRWGYLPVLSLALPAVLLLSIGQVAPLLLGRFSGPVSEFIAMAGVLAVLWGYVLVGFWCFFASAASATEEPHLSPINPLSGSFAESTAPPNPSLQRTRYARR